MGRRRDHYPRFNASICPDANACSRLYHGLGGPDGGDTCECCGETIEDEVARETRPLPPTGASHEDRVLRRL